MRRTTGTSPRRGVVALAALALLPAVLTACSGSDPKASRITDTPTPTQSASSPSPSATTPEQQIEAAVNRYYAELTKAAQTQDTSTLATLSTRGCPCYNIVRGIEEAKDQGLTSPDAAWTVRSVAVSVEEPRAASAEVKYTLAPYDVLKPDGSIDQHFDRQSGHVDLSFVRKSDQGPWVIGNLVNLES